MVAQDLPRESKSFVKLAYYMYSLIMHKYSHEGREVIPMTTKMPKMTEMKFKIGGRIPSHAGLGWTEDMYFGKVMIVEIQHTIQRVPS